MASGGRYNPGPGMGTRQYYHNSDSGVGSFSDQDNFPPNPDRVYAAQNPGQFSHPVTVREALKEANGKYTALKLQYRELETSFDKTSKELATRNKAYADLYSQWEGRGLRADVLEDDKKRLSAEKKTLAKEYGDLAEENENLAASNKLLDKENRDLLAENDSLADEIDRLREMIHKLGGPSVSPKMSGALPDDGEKHLRRRSSKKHKDEKHKDEKQKARLSARFDNNDNRRSHRSSVYTEPFGQPAPRSTSAAPARFPKVAVSTTSEPKYSHVPRKISRNSGTYTVPSNHRWVEDGMYHGHDYPVHP